MQEAVEPAVEIESPPLPPPPSFALDLALDPADAPRLLRLKALAPFRAGAGRLRAAPARRVWHDSADAALMQDGLALVQVLAPAQDGWRLERAMPVEGERWPPGTPAPVLATVESPETLDFAGYNRAMPAPLLPFAAFEGRRVGVPLSDAAGGVSLFLLEGTLRAVTSEHPVCRVELSGPDPAAVMRLADTVAAELRLSVPRASLAAEALALARGTEPTPRHKGAPEVPQGLSVAEAFAMIVGHLTDAMLHFVPDILAGAEGPEPVHQMRVATRRLRSAFGLFRRAIETEATQAAEAELRKLGHTLGPARDWDVFVAGNGAAIGKAFEDDRAVKRMLAQAERRRRAVYASLQEYLSSAAFRRLGLSLAAIASGANLAASTDHAEDEPAPTALDRYAARVMSRRYQAIISAGENIGSLPAHALHPIRLDAKRLRYACEFFAPLFPGRHARRFVRRLTVLQDQLGLLNDGIGAAALMAELTGAGGENGYARGIALGFVAAQSVASRATAMRAWERFRAVEPFWTKNGR